MKATQVVEALLFASEAPLSAADVARADESLDEDAVEAAIQQLRMDYESQGRAFQIYEIAGGFQVLTRPEFAPYLERFDAVPQNSRLSSPALEVLAIIAYRQPISRVEIEEIRGVGSSGVIKTLSDRSLIETVGRSEGLGRPLLYGTTRVFLDHFGFRSLEDLPRPEELPVLLKERTVVPDGGPSIGRAQRAEGEVGTGRGAEAGTGKAAELLETMAVESASAADAGAEDTDAGADSNAGPGETVDREPADSTR